MDLDRLNRWLTLLANIGVVTGIIFLAIEVSQNSDQIEQSTSVSRGQAIFQINQSANTYYEVLVQNPELVEILERGNTNPDTLNDVEAKQFEFLMRRIFNGHEAAYFYYIQGIADDDYMNGANAALCSRVSTNGGQWFWERSSRYYADGFVKLIENCI